MGPVWRSAFSITWSEAGAQGELSPSRRSARQPGCQDGWLRAHLSAWTGRRICLLLCAAVVRVVASVPRGRIGFPGIPHGDRQISYGALPGKRLCCRLPATGAIG
jgi:hypothetical protein